MQKKNGVGFTDMSKCLVLQSYVTSKIFFQALYSINTAAFSLDGNEYIYLLPMRKMKSPYSYAITKHSRKQKGGKIVDKHRLNI